MTGLGRLLQAGESPLYVQRRRGHASIQLTALPLGNEAAVDQLDAQAVLDHARAV